MRRKPAPGGQWHLCRRSTGRLDAPSFHGYAFMCQQIDDDLLYLTDRKKLFYPDQGTIELRK